MEIENKSPRLCLVALMGLPASGKTSFTQRLTEIVFSIPNSCIKVVNYDDFVPLQLQQRFPECHGTAKILRKAFLDSIETIAKRVISATSLNVAPDVSKLGDCISEEAKEEINRIYLKGNEKIQEIEVILSQRTCENLFLVIDDNNYYQSMRNDIYQIAKRLSCSFCILYMYCPVDIAMARNSNRSENERVPGEVIEEMHKKLEPPDSIANPSDMFCVQIDTTVALDSEIEQSLRTLFQYALQCPVHSVQTLDRSEDRRLCSENEVHQADIVLRKWVSSQITICSFTTHTSATSRKEKIKMLTNTKAATLAKLRSGEYKISSRIDQDVDFHKEIVTLAGKVEAELYPVC